MDYSQPGSFVHGHSPGKNAGVGGDVPNPEVKPSSHALQVDSLAAELPGKPISMLTSPNSRSVINLQYRFH